MATVPATRSSVNAANSAPPPKAIKKAIARSEGFQNNVVNAPLFYLRGGYDLSKIKGPHGAILKQISKSLISAAENPGAKADIIAAANDLKNNEDFVSIDRLIDVLQWYTNK